MAKKSKKRVARYQRDQSGCMWGLINIFDFRNGRSSQKLLADKKRGSRRLDGAAYTNIQLESLTESCEICNDTNGLVACESSTTDIGKLSVKELMEEEMLGEHDQKKEESITSGEPKPSTTSLGAHTKKNRRWTKNKLSLDLDNGGFISTEDLISGRSGHRKHKSCSSIDLNVIVEELCNRIHDKDGSCLEHGLDGGPSEDLSVIEKKLWESTKVLMNHFSDGNGCCKDGKFQPSKELRDALQILNSNKEFFLKLLQDPCSQLVKNIQSSQDIQVEDGKFKVLTRSDTLEQDMGNVKQGFFRRRFKSLERNSSKKSDFFENISKIKSLEKNSSKKPDFPQDISKIVVLKPGPPSSGNSNTTTPCSSLPESPRVKCDKPDIERTFSPFSFAEFKRKLKHAMRKDQQGLSHQSDTRDKKVSGETMGMASPTRDHFFIERLPKSPVGNKTVKLKNGTALTPEQRVSNIYIEAKKHLAEIVGNSDLDAVLEHHPGKRRPRSLGKILAYNGYNSPICSPRTEGELRVSPNGECQPSVLKTLPQVTKEVNDNHLGQTSQEIESETCLASEKPILETEVPIVEPRVSEDLPRDSNVDKPIQEAEVSISKDAIKYSNAESENENVELEISSQLLSPECITKSEYLCCPSTCSEENLHPTCLKQDVCGENEPSSSLNASTLIFKGTENFDDLETMSDATSRPSPISVLDPVFQEDDISPPGLKFSNAVVEQIRPRQIQFGEEISAQIQKVPSNIICVDEKYTIKFVKDVLQMSGLSWDELLRRSLFADHLVDPSLLDEVDFLPDLLSCDFNVLFDLISEVLIELYRFNFGSLLSLATPYVHPKSKGKDFFTEVWKGVDWYLKMEGPRRTLDLIIEKDLAKTDIWVDLQLDSQNIGIQIEEAIFEDLVEDMILGFDAEGSKIDFLISLSTEGKETDVRVEV